MNLEEMSREELIEAAKQAGGELPSAASVKTVEVDGMEVHIDTDQVKSWKMFKLVSQLDGELDAKAIALMFEVIELATDVDEEKIVEHCGGENATMEAVILTASRIIKELYPKN